MFKNIIKNEVTILKKENKKQLEHLKENDKDIITDIMKSMSIFKINSYDSEVIKRDLIGMSQELSLRNSSLKENIGENLDKFKKDIISNSNGPSKIEILLGYLCRVSGYLFISFTGLAFLAFGGLTWNVNPVIIFYYIAFASIVFITEGIITPVFSTKKGFLKNLPSIISITLLAMLTIIIYFINNMESTKIINVSYIIVVSGLVYLISSYFYIKNIHKLAKNKRNYIQDLR